MKKKRHTPQEISVKLRQADEMVAQGKRHSEVAKALGVSVMTYHRWRKARVAGPAHAPSAAAAVGAPRNGRALSTAASSDLQVENSRLRRLVANLLLEKVRLEEALGNTKSGTGG